MTGKYRPARFMTRSVLVCENVFEMISLSSLSKTSVRSSGTLSPQKSICVGVLGSDESCGLFLADVAAAVSSLNVVVAFVKSQKNAAEAISAAEAMIIFLMRVVCRPVARACVSEVFMWYVCALLVPCHR